MWPGFDTCKVRLDSLSPRDTLADAETAEQISIIAGSFKSISLTQGQEEPIYDTDHTDLNSDFDELDLRAELLKDFDPEGFGEIPVNDFLVALKSPEFQSQVPLSKRELLYDRALLSAEAKGGSGSVSFQDFVNVIFLPSSPFTG
ncbi:hypothetical protein HA402_001748 [Bradysia odoriphaga]|nr:hypothetical protein HA402_001748 [Bradysia odoriphaga]